MRNRQDRLMFVSNSFQCNDLCDDVRMSRFDSLLSTESLMNIETRSRNLVQTLGMTCCIV